MFSNVPGMRMRGHFYLPSGVQTLMLMTEGSGWASVTISGPHLGAGLIDPGTAGKR